MLMRLIVPMLTTIALHQAANDPQLPFPCTVAHDTTGCILMLLCAATFMCKQYMHQPSSFDQLRPPCSYNAAQALRRLMSCRYTARTTCLMRTVS